MTRHFQLNDAYSVLQKNRAVGYTQTGNGQLASPSFTARREYP